MHFFLYLERVDVLHCAENVPVLDVSLRGTFSVHGKLPFEVISQLSPRASLAFQEEKLKYVEYCLGLQGLMARTRTCQDKMEFSAWFGRFCFISIYGSYYWQAWNNKKDHFFISA